MHRWISATFLALASLAAAAQDVPKMMFLGSGHLANHNRDVANTHVEDVRTPARQAEIEQMVARLAAWKPTHIAIEYPYAKQAELDKRYADYRAGRYALSADETDQIGLRLAKQLGLPRVDAVDWNGDAPGKDADYDWMAWAKAHGKTDLLEKTIAPWKAEAAKETEYLKSHSVTDWYLTWNDPKRMNEDAKATSSSRSSATIPTTRARHGLANGMRGTCASSRISAHWRRSREIACSSSMGRAMGRTCAKTRWSPTYSSWSNRSHG
jgi:hypothetical protein